MLVGPRAETESEIGREDGGERERETERKRRGPITPQHVSQSLRSLRLTVQDLMEYKMKRGNFIVPQSKREKQR